MQKHSDDFINIKNWYHNHCSNLIEAEKLETKKFLFDEKTLRIWWFILLDMLTVSQ